MTEQVVDYEKLAEMLLAKASVTQKEAGSTPTASYGHGRGGIFSTPGLERPVFSALMLPNLGLQSRLPAFTSNETDPLFGIMTGVTASTGSEPVGVCDDPPYAGLMKICDHYFVFGRQSRRTKVFEINRMGKRINRADMGDLQLMNRPFGQVNNPNVPVTPLSPGQAVNNEVQKALYELAVSWGRDFARVIYTGNPSNNTAGGGYMEPMGLDILINTGYRDVITSTVCPAADSIVRSFGNADLRTNGMLFVRTVTNMYRNLKFIASRTGLNPVKWVICMPWSMFYEVTEVWPCAYMTYRCQGTGTFDANQVNQVNSSELIAMRDQMRGDIFNYTGQYLMIDGERVEVVIDDAIPEAIVAGASFRATMYFVPLTVMGGTNATYFESFNFDGPNGPMEAAKVFAPDGSYYTSDGGRFIWHRKPPHNWCVELEAKTEPRIILLTPMIAARLTGIQYTPLAHERNWDPGASYASYYVNGGNTGRDILQPSYYTNQ